MSIISSIFYWFLDLHIFFQIVIGIVLLAVVYGIIDEVFGLSRKEEIKKIAKKYGISEEQLKEIVETVGCKYPKDLLKKEDDESVKGEYIDNVEELHNAIDRFSTIITRYNLTLEKLKECLDEAYMLYPSDIYLTDSKYTKTIKEINKTICPSCNTVGSFEEDLSKSYFSAFRFIGRKDFKEEDGITRNMEVFERASHEIRRCNQCNYEDEIDGGKFEYTTKEIVEREYRCPKCNEWGTVYLKDVKQLERYASNKEVEETTSRGTKTRYIKVMKSLEEETYCCHNCDFVSVATVTRDLD